MHASRLMAPVLLTLGAMALAGGLPEPGGPNVDPKKLSVLTHGLTAEKVAERLGSTGWHQFTVDLDNRAVQCIGYCRDDVYRFYYLVFSDNKLTRICSPPPPKMAYRRTLHGEVGYAVIGNPLDRASEVLSAPDLTGERLRKEIGLEKRYVQHVDVGLTASFLLTGQLWGKAEGGPLDKRLAAAVRRKMDPSNVLLGSGRSDVEKKLGDPAIEDNLGAGRKLCSYGPPPGTASLPVSREFLWVTVVYHHGKVQAKFSHHFVDWDKIGRLSSGPGK